MSNKSQSAPTHVIGDFVEALIEQLDNVQDSLALKVLTGRPLTWAIKDISLDLQVFLGVSSKGDITIRNAQPNEQGHSTLHLSLSTITREMANENTYSFEADDDPRSLEAAGLDETQIKRLNRLGVRTVGQLKKVSEGGAQQEALQRSGVPASDLMRALQASSRPTVMSHYVERNPEGDPLVHIFGANLYDGVTPEVRFCGEPVEVLEAQPRELLVRPRAHHDEGQVEVRVGGLRCTGYFRIPDRAETVDRSRAAAGNGSSATTDQAVADPWASGSEDLE